MSVHIRIPSSLHRLIPSEVSASSMVRQLVTSAAANNDLLIAAIANRRYFDTPQDEISRHMIYMTGQEQEEASKLAAKYMYSTNQLIQILLEGIMYDAGVWPPLRQFDSKVIRGIGTISDLE